MPKTEQPEALRVKQEERTKKIREGVEQAVRNLKKVKEPVTLATVAREAGVHRTTLYLAAYRDLLEKIRAEEAKENHRPQPQQGAPRTSEESWKTRYDVAMSEVKRLREENQALRDQLGRVLGAARERR